MLRVALVLVLIAIVAGGQFVLTASGLTGGVID
jgi:hypothetical protein